eukprot:CAMPEP_0119123816 /NCGR_PEP_ID=MMETSP1310-20130426/3620_1 /TAXON_ID=464262 /ORGANISM="Genus nov. species nov., Strain RCC2339" /LENGTH=238 /DNA_ID=CAMNT_0007113683 /DNA_START=40 /DNA_END=753 /DNA_ORIENTATION=-
MEERGETVSLVIKSPATPGEAFEVEDFDLKNTVGDLKQYLAAHYNGRPEAERQRLIFGGKVLRNEESLKNVFARKDVSVRQTIHLVVSVAPQQHRPQQAPPFEAPAGNHGFGAVHQNVGGVGMGVGRGGHPQHFHPHQGQFGPGVPVPGVQHAHHIPQPGGENIGLLVKLAILVFILAQGGTSERVFLLTIGAMVIYIYQTGRLRFVHRMHFHVQVRPAAPAGRHAPPPQAEGEAQLR